MRKRGLIALALLVACGRSPESPPAPAAVAAIATEQTPAKGDPVEGLRVAKRVGCTGCHMDDGRGGGFDIKTPEGDHLVAPNLTERRTLYDDAGLAALLREGKTHDGHRPIGMPVHMLQRLSDREVADITAWLRALPVVANPGLAQSSLSPASRKQVEAGTYPFDDDLPDPGNVPPAAPPTEALALGRHIAMTSCPECHGRELTGWGPDDPAPSLVVINKAYTPANFARLMKTGIASNGKDTATGSMSRVARDRFATLTDAEIAALKLYLDSR